MQATDCGRVHQSAVSCITVLPGGGAEGAAPSALVVSCADTGSVVLTDVAAAAERAASASGAKWPATSVGTGSAAATTVHSIRERAARLSLATRRRPAPTRSAGLPSPALCCAPSDAHTVVLGGAEGAAPLRLWDVRTPGGCHAWLQGVT